MFKNYEIRSNPFFIALIDNHFKSVMILIGG